MKNLIEAIIRFAKSDTSTFLNFVFGLIGVIGTLIAVQQVIAGKRKDRINAFILKQAELNLDKSLTDTELAEGKRQIGEISKQIRDLQEKIRNEIPIEAKRAALRDRLNTHLESIARLHVSVLEAEKDLKALGEPAPVPPEVLKEIASYISPEYANRVRVANLKTILTVSTSSAAIFGAILPYPIDRWLTTLIFLAVAPIALQLTMMWVKSAPEARRWLWVVSLALPFIMSIALAAFGATLLLLNASGLTPVGRIIAVASLVLASVIFVFGVILLLRSRTRQP